MLISIIYILKHSSIPVFIPMKTKIFIITGNSNITLTNQKKYNNMLPITYKASFLILSFSSFS